MSLGPYTPEAHGFGSQSGGDDSKNSMDSFLLFFYIGFTFEFTRYLWFVMCRKLRKTEEKIDSENNIEA